VGDSLTYTYTLTNTSTSSSISQANIPYEVLDATNQGAGDRNTFTSSLFGDIEAAAVAEMRTAHPSYQPSNTGVGFLQAGQSFSFTETHTVTTADLPGPINESATAVFTLAQAPTGETFTNQISASNST